MTNVEAKIARMAGFAKKESPVDEVARLMDEMGFKRSGYDEEPNGEVEYENPRGVTFTTGWANDRDVRVVLNLLRKTSAGYAAEAARVAEYNLKFAKVS